MFEYFSNIVNSGIFFVIDNGKNFNRLCNSVLLFFNIIKVEKIIVYDNIWDRYF